MTLKQKHHLAKIVDKYYWKYNQVITVTTMEIRDKNSCGLDVCLYYPDKKEEIDRIGQYLFEIVNYKAFTDVEIRGDIDNDKHEWYETFDSVKASCTPYYMDRVYCVPKFTGITEADILRATRKFIRKELDLLCFNFRIAKQEEDKPKRKTKKKIKKGDLK
jgi:hypothetical protein